ncbi:MAG: hypothetical protein AAGL98_16750, partial [Planctomycetota bacterium]
MFKSFLTPRRLRRWSAAGVVLLIVWAAVGVVVQRARELRPSPAALVQAAAAVEPARAAMPETQTRLDQIIRTVQRLSPKERMQPEVQDALRRSFSAMSPEQQMRFVDSVLPMGLEQMVAAYQSMGDDQKRLVTEKLYSEFSGRGWLPEDTDAATFATLLNENAAKFLDAPDAETRLELLP